MTISRWILLRMRNVSYNSCRENQNTYFMYNKFLLRRSCLLWDNVEETWWSQAGHRWQHNTAQALCILDNEGYKHTLIMLSHDNNGYANAPQCCFIRTLPVLSSVYPMKREICLNNGPTWIANSYLAGNRCIFVTGTEHVSTIWSNNCWLCCGSCDVLKQMARGEPAVFRGTEWAACRL
jgi:hypothetical protein